MVLVAQRDSRPFSGEDERFVLSRQRGRPDRAEVVPRPPRQPPQPAPVGLDDKDLAAAALPAAKALREGDPSRVGKRPARLATGGGSVWVANGGERTISEIDPRTNEVVSTIPTQFYPRSVAYGHSFLWVSLGSDPDGF
jgi:YVTN family beta-propeller protein